jgi:Uma2 family endonuclease
MHATRARELVPRRWSRSEYERLIEHDFFGPEERLELIDGEIVTVAPQKSLHTSAIGLLQMALANTFGVDHVRVQSPIALDPASQPEPDLAVVAGDPRHYRDRHPASALLVVEVSDTTLSFDRATKSSLYARAGFREYWILNLVRGELEVYRDPVEEPGARYGWSYRIVERLGADGFVEPLAAPGARIAVADLLP